jgi:hypothetical protein
MKNTQPIIRYQGLGALDNTEKVNVEKICTDYHPKIQRSLGKSATIKVQIKTYDDEGTKKKYSVTLNVVAADKKIFTSHLADWDLSRVLHKTFKYLNREILKKKKTDDKGTGIKRPMKTKK